MVTCLPALQENLPDFLSVQYRLPLLYRRLHFSSFPAGTDYLFCTGKFTSLPFRPVPTTSTVPAYLSGTVLNGNLSPCSTGKLTRLAFRTVSATSTVPTNSPLFLSVQYRISLLYRRIHFFSFPAGIACPHCTGEFTSPASRMVSSVPTVPANSFLLPSGRYRLPLLYWLICLERFGW